MFDFICPELKNGNFRRMHIRGQNVCSNNQVHYQSNLVWSSRFFALVAISVCLTLCNAAALCHGTDGTMKCKTEKTMSINYILLCGLMQPYALSGGFLHRCCCNGSKAVWKKQTKRGKYGSCSCMCVSVLVCVCAVCIRTKSVGARYLSLWFFCPGFVSKTILFHAVASSLFAACIVILLEFVVEHF